MSANGDDGPLAGRVIGITADRRWQEQASLFERRGARVVHAATMRTLDLRQDERLRRLTGEMIASPPEVLVATTGQGMKWWLEVAGEWRMADELKHSLASTEIIARGAKSASAVRAAGLEVAWQAPNESMAEIAEHLRGRSRRPSTIAVQLYDPDDEGGAVASVAGLASRATLVPLYRWDLPADTSDVVDLIDATIDARLDAVTFTSQPAVRNLFRIAADHGREDELRVAFDGPVLAVCVGPVCAEAGRDCGITAMRWPELNRLPAMVRLTTELLSQS